MPITSDYDGDLHRFTCRECGRNHSTADHDAIAERFPGVAIRADKCPHEEFSAVVNVARVTKGEDGPVGGFMADIRIHCVQCDAPFEFIGVEPGMLWSKPMCSPDAQELRAPLRPKGSAVMPAMPGFTMSVS